MKEEEPVPQLIQCLADLEHSHTASPESTPKTWIDKDQAYVRQM